MQVACHKKTKMAYKIFASRGTLKHYRRFLTENNLLDYDRVIVRHPRISKEVLGFFFCDQLINVIKEPTTPQ